ncbi:Cysteine-rich secretory protein family/Bacterial Ig-like domain (group 2), partial [Lachnospiraceae bacterium NE2001]
MKRKLRQFVAIALSAAMAVLFGSFGSIPGSFSSNIPGLLTEVNASSLTVKDNIETTASSGKIIIGVEGVNCTSDMKTLLDRINKIRKEACDAGNVPDPRDTTKCLKSSDYKPLQIGVNTMKAAEMRAAEASLNFTHTRPNGKNSYTIIRSFVPNTSVAENLAWNSKMSSDIEGWISEKDDWIKYKGDDSEANIGHYGALINPDYLYTGMATFNPVNDSAPYDWSCTEGSYSSDDTALSKLPGVQNSTYIQKMEIPISNVTASDVVGESVVSIGSSVDYQLLVAAKFTSDYTNVVVDCPVYSGLSWSTSDSTVITIDSTGKATAKKAGRASITAVFGSKKASREIVVVPNDTSVTSVANPSMVTTETKTVPVLAKSVEATLSDGQKVNVDATWKIYDTARLLTHFMSYEFDVKGTAMGKKVTQRVHVNAAKIEDVYPSVSDVTTNCGSLPQNITVKVVLSNGYTWNYPSNWNSYYFTVWDRDSLEQCNTAAGGDFKITGYIKIKTDKGVEKFPVSVDLHVNPGTPSTDLMKNIPVIGTDVNNYAGGGISVEETDFNDDLDEPDEDPEDSGSGGNGSDSGSGGSGGNGSDSGSGGSG